MRSAPCASTSLAAKAGSASAAVPTTTRAAPPSKAGRDIALRPKPAADLNEHPLPNRSDDPTNDLGLRRTPAACAIEVDDMQPGRARRHEPAGQRDGIVGVRGLACEVALAQAYHPAITEVDRGQKIEDCQRPASVLSCYYATTLP